MASKANHHFIPQFYLRGFADGVGRKARVFTVDNQNKSTFTTLVRNVGSKRHFNRVEIDGVDPNAVEDAMAEVEGQFANHLAEVIARKDFPTQDHFNSIMNLIASVSVRTPRLRSLVEEFHRDVARSILGIALATKERLESQK